MRNLINEEDWSIISSYFPPRWQWQVKKTGAVQRMRGVKTYEKLFRLLMLHISGGLSLTQTCVRARTLGIAKITSTALHKRLCCAQPWFEWLCAWFAGQRGAGGFTQGALAGRRMLAVDGSDIREPGAKGSSWRLHYALELPRLCCAHAAFTTHKQGESLKHFPIREGDVVMADRAYAKRGQLAWLIGQKADAIVRMSPSHFPVETNDSGADESDLPFDWLGHLRALKGHKPGEWTVRFSHEGQSHTVRVCAVRKSVAAQRKAIREIEKEARKKKRAVKPGTLEYAKYVMVLTTLPADVLGTREVLETYRGRWQVELAFKRLKSLIECGSVPKSDPCTALAWMQGKLLEALLVEKLLEEAGVFSPWGHRMGGEPALADLQGCARDGAARTGAGVKRT